MADLGFAEDSNLQDGTGDSTYPDFLHKYVAMIGVGVNLCSSCFLPS